MHFGNAMLNIQSRRVINMPGNDETEKEREKITSFTPATGKGRPGPRSKATRWTPSVGTILCCALLLVLAPIMAINSLWHEGPDHVGCVTIIPQ